MRTRLALQALTKLLLGLIIIGLILFLPAGDFGYRNGWVFIIVMFTPMILLGCVMLAKSPELLQKRLNAKEKMSEQRWVVKLSGLLFSATFIIAGLCYRYDWAMLPQWTMWLGVGVFLLSYVMYAEVMRENAYLSRTIEIQEGQQVIDSGLYAIVRHPMYTATILLFLSIPVILGSLISFLVMLLYIPIIAQRIRYEEQFLDKELDGYREYKKRVRYKIIPFTW